MAKLEFKEGDRVIYHPTGAGNESVGIIKKILEEPPLENVSKEDYPRYLIENEHTGKETIYKPEAVVSKAD